MDNTSFVDTEWVIGTFCSYVTVLIESTPQG